MRFEHFETYLQGHRWWVARLEHGGECEPASGATEAEALMAMCEQLHDEIEDLHERLWEHAV